MDQAEALLGGLRAKAALGETRVDAAGVEALASALSIDRARLPALVDGLAKRQPPVVAPLWGGGLEVLPQPAVGGGAGIHVYNQQGAVFTGAQAFGAYAQGGTVQQSLDAAAIGALAEVMLRLEALRRTVAPDAAAAIDETIQALREQPAAEAPVEARKRWSGKVRSRFATVLAAAPGAKAAIEIGEKAVDALASLLR